ncbi:eukaryotic translation initiation factor 2 beta subunit [Chrysochromulina tobinii]|uniref:Eukaryotic translation initiation factor 2 beta subunit n=1 Tax=Chrysochromulina tobinii TaxID=1460289 RepID=A0A0M0JFN9_9EUKA|nr:eukaryotic translation initiation factor 2 beta subunit [Chrysochromulina tobinii]|eukprot:KOO25406.1 eukaryotic translation initiation factor 2 beta subunit [Chrysochromulina sp. CCMP291]
MIRVKALDTCMNNSSTPKWHLQADDEDVSIDFSLKKKKAAAEDKKPAAAAAEEDEDESLDFSKIKKKKKKPKDGEEEGGDGPTPPPPAPSAAAADDDDDESLDFSKIPKKKKKPKEDEAAAAAPAPAEEGEDEVLDFSKSKKKPKKPKEDEGADDKAEKAEGATGAAEGDDGEGEDDDDDREYKYEELLDRMYSLLHANNPELAGDRKRFLIKPPQVVREGSKRVVLTNFGEICETLNRSMDHVYSFMLAEMGTTGSIDASSRMVIKGRFPPKAIEQIIRRYVGEYVSCSSCKSPATALQKQNRLYFMQCNNCGARRSVTPIKTGFVAISRGARKKNRAV